MVVMIGKYSTDVTSYSDNFFFNITLMSLKMENLYLAPLLDFYLMYPSPVYCHVEKQGNYYDT